MTKRPAGSRIEEVRPAGGVAEDLPEARTTAYLSRVVLETAGRALCAVSRRARRRLSDLPADTHGIAVPTRHGPVACTVHRPAQADADTPVHVTVHGGGFVIRFPEQDDAWCRYLATHAGVIVLNVDHDIAPPHRFPVPVEQVPDVLARTAGADREWDGSRIGVGEPNAERLEGIAPGGPRRRRPPSSPSTCSRLPSGVVPPAADRGTMPRLGQAIGPSAGWRDQPAGPVTPPHHRPGQPSSAQHRAA